MPETANSASPPQDRVVRVFISSTFRDMQAEREELVKRVFPQLRKLCEERGVGFVDVDLRWGVTDEEVAEGRVLPICLAEIDRCRPFFIGLLGERYGWVPQQIPNELIESQPWLAEHHEKSVTELEILHGVLNNLEMANRAIFYLRDPEYVDRIPPAQRSDFVEQDPQRRARLEALKGSIRRSGLALRENYPDPQALGQWVLEDLTVAINQMFPVTEVPGPLDREGAEHDVFARSRTGVYVGRQEYFDRLNEHAAGDGLPLVVLGESGSGKSALLANWAVRYRHEHSDTLVLLHFIGATPDSADWAAMLRRILSEFKRRFDIQQDIPEKPDALRAAFANWLHMTAAHGRVVVVLDALNQLEDRDGAPDLVWLPPLIPDGVRMVFSTLPGRALDDLKRREWPTFTVEPLRPPERMKVLWRHLRQYRKRLSKRRRRQIVLAEQTANPLYLRALLDELRVFGVHERLDERIGYYLVALTVPELYGRILKRWEDDYEPDRPGLVRDAMTALWAARRGLGESELLELLGTGGEALPRAHWSPLFLAANQSLVIRSGLIGFFHGYVRKAVEVKYLPTLEGQQKAHIRLAAYFADRDQSARKLDELPWQLAQAGSWPSLHDLLSDGAFVIGLFNHGEFDLQAYWAQLETNTSLSRLDAYRSIIEEPEANTEAAWCVAELLAETDHCQEARRIYASLLTILGDSGPLETVRNCMNSLGLVLNKLGASREAVGIFHRMTRFCLDRADVYGATISLENEAMILMDEGRFDDALRLFAESRNFLVMLKRESDTGFIDLKEAHIFQERGDLQQAHSSFECALRWARSAGKRRHEIEAIRGLANVCYLQSRFAEAVRLEKQAEGLNRSLGLLTGVSACLNFQGVLHKAIGELPEALSVQEEAGRIDGGLGDRYGLACALGNQAETLLLMGDVDGAMARNTQSLEIFREQRRKPHIATGLINQGIIEKHLGHLERAISCFEEAEAISRETDSPEPLSLALSNRAEIVRGLGRYEDALVLVEEAERLLRKMGNLQKLSRTLREKGLILLAMNRQDSVGAFQEGFQIATDLGLQRDAIAIMETIQRALYEAREYELALGATTERERLCRDAGDRTSLADVLGRRGELLLRQGHPKEAANCYRQSAEVCRATNQQARHLRVLLGLARALRELDDSDGTLRVLRDAEAAATELQDPRGEMVARLLQAQVLGFDRKQVEDAEVVLANAIKQAAIHGLAGEQRELETLRQELTTMHGLAAPDRPEG